MPTVQIECSVITGRIAQNYCFQDVMVVKAQTLLQPFCKPNLSSEIQVVRATVRQNAGIIRRSIQTWASGPKALPIFRDAFW